LISIGIDQIQGLPDEADAGNQASAGHVSDAIVHAFHAALKPDAAHTGLGEKEN